MYDILDLYNGHHNGRNKRKTRIGEYMVTSDRLQKAKRIGQIAEQLSGLENFVKSNLAVFMLTGYTTGGNIKLDITLTRNEAMLAIEQRRDRLSKELVELMKE
jgi:hypothetical protein